MSRRKLGEVGNCAEVFDSDESHRYAPPSFLKLSISSLRPDLSVYPTQLRYVSAIFDCLAYWSSWHKYLIATMCQSTPLLRCVASSLVSAHLF